MKHYNEDDFDEIESPEMRAIEQMDACLLLWSEDQKCFHFDTITDCIVTNSMSLINYPITNQYVSYILVWVGTREDCEEKMRFLTRLRSVNEQNPSN